MDQAFKLVALLLTNRQAMKGDKEVLECRPNKKGEISIALVEGLKPKVKGRAASSRS